MAHNIADPVPGTDYLEEYDRAGKLLSRAPMPHAPEDDARIADLATIQETAATADASLTGAKLARAVKAIARMVS